MGRSWFNLTGGFDEGMHGWGGENLVVASELVPSYAWN